MDYTQLIQPNLSIVGQDGLCLAYVRAVFGATGSYPSATVGWQDAQYKHSGNPPSNISVPVWFSYNGPDGHVAVWAEGTIHSTSAQGMKTFSSISSLCAWMGEGMTYLGWSEDVDKLRVVQPQGGIDDMIPDVGHLDALFQNFIGRPSNAAEQAQYLGPNQLGYSVLIERLNDPKNSEFQAYHQIISTGETATKDQWANQIYGLEAQVKQLQSGLNKSEVVLYIQNNLN